MGVSKQFLGEKNVVLIFVAPGRGFELNYENCLGNTTGKQFTSLKLVFTFFGTIPHIRIHTLFITIRIKGNKLHKLICGRFFL